MDYDRLAFNNRIVHVEYHYLCLELLDDWHWVLWIEDHGTGFAVSDVKVLWKRNLDFADLTRSSIFNKFTLVLNIDDFHFDIIWSELQILAWHHNTLLHFDGHTVSRKVRFTILTLAVGIINTGSHRLVGLFWERSKVVYYFQEALGFDFIIAVPLLEFVGLSLTSS